jgi:hypothetical protein
MLRTNVHSPRRNEADRDHRYDIKAKKPIDKGQSRLPEAGHTNRSSIFPSHSLDTIRNRSRKKNVSSFACIQRPLALASSCHPKR